MDKDIMNVSIENLAVAQFNFLKEHGETILRKALYLLEMDDYEGLKKMLKFSPAGDGYGDESYFINFAYEEDSAMDINDLISKLERLNETIGKSK